MFNWMKGVRIGLLECACVYIMERSRYVEMEEEKGVDLKSVVVWR